MGEELLIIGAGTAGLVAGIYATRNGYRTTILEMGKTPGGLCTSWNRKGYQFDGSAAGLAGSGPGAPLWKLWNDCGIIDNCSLHNADNFGTIVLSNGRKITVYTNIDRLEEHLAENFTIDKGMIAVFIRGLRQCMKMDIPFSSETGIFSTLKTLICGIKTIPALPAVFRFGRLTLGEFIKNLKDPDCKEAFSHLVHFGGLDVPLLTVMLPIVYSHRKMTGIPVQGWISFARAMENRFVELGGNILYGKKVTSLAVAKGAVTGVILEDGSFISSKKVLSTVDGTYTQSTMLAAAGVSHVYQYKSETISDQPVQVSLGVSDDLTDNHGPITIVLNDQPEIAGCIQNSLTFHINYYNKSAAPEGKTSIIAFVNSEYRYWENIVKDNEVYRSEKERCASYVISVIERQFPGFSKKVEIIDVATPLTRMRFTGNWMGAMQGRKPDSGMIRSLLRGRVRYRHPELKGFYMAGQWVESWGGITTAALSGFNAIRHICKEDK